MAPDGPDMSKSVMVATGHIQPPPADALLGAVRLDVIIARGEALGAAWAYDLCSPFWRLYVNRQAGAELELDQRRMPLRAGRAYLLPAGLRFRTRLAKGVREVWQDYIHFEVRGIPPALLRKLFPAPVELPPAPELDALLATWRAGLGADGTPPADLGQRLRSMALVHAAFALGCAQATVAGRTAWASWLTLPPTVAPALRRIEERPDQPAGNSELARACGLGTRQFLRRFGEAVGLSPARYALERRVALAADALARTDEPVDQIAARLGFSDRFHFSKAFRARVGLPPAAYRRMHFCAA